MSRPDPAFLALQEAVAGRFSVEQELGRGGMGIVFLAQDVRLQRPVAIKLLSPALASRPEMRRRFLREARLAAQCFHPHIVPIHAVEEAGELAFFVMSYVRGQTLADRLRGGPLDAETVRRIGREIGWALDYAHARGVVHRDVKPENILLEDNTDRALITDFGIAVHDDPSITPHSGEVAGTVRYMAPEQALGDSVDGRADLYALGVTLYVAASGRHPFDGASAVALLAQQTARPAPSLAAAAPLVPDDLTDAIDRCLRQDPTERFDTAAAFVEAIQPRAVTAEIPTMLRPLDEHARSARSLVGWTGVLLGSTLLIAIGEPDSFFFGRDVVLGVGLILSGSIGSFGLFRFAEALREAKAAIARRVDGRALVRLLAGDVQEPVAQRSRRGAWVQLVLAAAMAVARGPITNSEWYVDTALPGAIGSILTLGTIVVPIYLLGRSAASLLAGSRVSRWFHRRVATPLARAAVRLLGGDVREETAGASALAAPTELRLDHQAQAILGRLPADVRAQLGDVPQVVAGLVRDAEALRRADAQLAGAERHARAGAAERDVLANIAAERAALRERLAASIAALETVRLDLLRLEAGAASGEDLTAHVEAVADLGRQVDAAGEVAALLARQTDPTPA